MIDTTLTIDALQELRNNIAEDAEIKVLAIERVIRLLETSPIPAQVEKLPVPEPAAAPVSNSVDGFLASKMRATTQAPAPVRRGNRSTASGQAFAACKTLKQPFTTADLKAALGCDTKTASNRITQLTHQKRIERISTGVFQVPGLGPKPAVKELSWGEFKTVTHTREEDMG